MENRTPEQYFSPEKYCEAVQRAHERSWGGYRSANIKKGEHDCVLQ
jgi:hypothetical protein